MSWKKYAAGAGGAVVGGLIGNIPGAVYGGELAYNMAKEAEKTYQMYPTPSRTPRKRKFVPVPDEVIPVKKRKGLKTMAKKFRKGKVLKRMIKVAKRRRSRKGVSAVTGTSFGFGAGKFNNPKRKNLKQFSQLTSFLKRGYHVTKEDHGIILDPSCTYLYHTNYRPYIIARLLAGAILRKLFRKAGLEIDNMENELPLYDWGNSDGFRIQFLVKNPVDNTIVATNQDIVDNKTFENVVDDSMGPGNIGEFMWAYIGNANFRNPYKVMLYLSDRNGLSTNWRLVSELSLENEKVHLFISSKAVLQNRTKGSGATAENADVDRVDNQPLKGNIYQFGNPDPRLRVSQHSGGGVGSNEDYVYNSGDWNHGIRTFGGSSLIGTNGKAFMSEPPAPKLWKNIDKVSKIFLQPGDMKNTGISDSYSNYLCVILKKLRADVQGIGPGNLGAVFKMVTAGTSQIIALEEVMRTPSDNLINITYEVEFKGGAYLETKKKFSVLQSDFIAPTDAIVQFVQ